MTISQFSGQARGLLRTGGALAALLLSASAMADTIAYSGSGIVSGPAQTPPVLTGLTLTSATSTFTVGVDPTWHVDKLFFFNTATLLGGGSFSFSNGVSSFSGSFTSSRANSTAPTSLLYTVTGGTGAYAGYTGSGFGYGSTVGNPFALPAATVTFTEGGYFNISAVPEPGSAWLLALGLGSALLWRRRVAGDGARGGMPA